MKRIAIILGIAAAIGVSASAAQAESNIMKTKHDTVKNVLSNVR